MPRTGARLLAPAIDGDRLTATGTEPGRGELRLETTFADSSFEGALHTEWNRRRVTGTSNPAAQLDRIASNVRAAEARADSAFAEAAAVRAQRESQQATARELDVAREQLESASRPAPVATPAAPAQTGRQGAERRCHELAIAAATPQPGGIDACRAAIREQPAKAFNHDNLGVAPSRAGRHQEAVRAYQEAAGLWSR